MNIVDSSGWIEFAADEENADFFKRAILNADNLLIPTVCIYEVFKRVMREFGEEIALEIIAQMSSGRIVELDRQIAINAAKISNESKLAMADSIILATARIFNATLWTQDEHFKNIEGVKYIEKTYK
ncbi:MAG: VapC toxin family PIN domain ribonuclease [Anaerolineae bacterium]|nr:type II toxin-antitoxin system VapC family toxin [Chloroflexi bacterium CFX1]MCQ3946497.1 VapC toxin family PIN domain ribonuclease [Anaerolineae bacterium]